MICVQYRIAPSHIEGAGQGFFLAEAVPAASIITAPTGIDRTWPLADILTCTDPAICDSSVRWFEDQCMVTPEWPDDCYINHSYRPNALWHLGFVFAARDLAPGTELTLDYGHLIAPGVTLPWIDSESGRAITGYSWEHSMRSNLAALSALFAQDAARAGQDIAAQERVSARKKSARVR